MAAHERAPASRRGASIWCVRAAGASLAARSAAAVPCALDRRCGVCCHALPLSLPSLQASLAESAWPRCRAFFVPLRRAALLGELELVVALSRAAAASAPAGHAFFLASEAASAPAYAARDAAAEAEAWTGSPRSLATWNGVTYAAVGNITMVPEIMAGLLISLLLFFFVAIGLRCTLDIKGPDILMSTHLAAGKEY